MAIILVDTDVYSCLSSNNRARGAPYKRHLDGHILALSFVTVGEQYAGYRKRISKGEWPESRIQKLEAMLKSVVIIPYDDEICKVYGDLKYKIRNPDGSHRVIGQNDLWIAACSPAFFEVGYKQSGPLSEHPRVGYYLRGSAHAIAVGGRRRTRTLSTNGLTDYEAAPGASRESPSV